MIRIRTLACVIGAAWGAGAWTGSAAQTPAQREQIERMAPQIEESARQQREMFDRLNKENDARNAGMKQMQDMMKQQREGLSKFKPELTVRPLEGAKPPRGEGSASRAEPPPSHVVYGETRAGTEAKATTAALRKPAAPRAPERPLCVYKPVMSNDEISACR